MVILVMLICGAIYRVILSALGAEPPTGTRSRRGRRRGSRGTVRQSTRVASRATRSVARGVTQMAQSEQVVRRTYGRWDGLV